MLVEYDVITTFHISRVFIVIILWPHDVSLIFVYSFHVPSVRYFAITNNVATLCLLGTHDKFSGGDSKCMTIFIVLEMHFQVAV